MFYALVKVDWFWVLKAFEVKQSKAPPAPHLHNPTNSLVKPGKPLQCISDS